MGEEGIVYPAFAFLVYRNDLHDCGCDSSIEWHIEPSGWRQNAVARNNLPVRIQSLCGFRGGSCR
jgi:hypothetical protein